MHPTNFVQFTQQDGKTAIWLNPANINAILGTEHATVYLIGGQHFTLVQDTDTVLQLIRSHVTEQVQRKAA
jgi:uncharacterized protein YlzI (FlbEa/FlbD family)